MSASPKAVAVQEPTHLQEVPRASPGDLMFEVLSKGDLSNLSNEEIARYEVAVCESCGLNPLTKPFDVITLPGRDKGPDRKVLYANKNATDQLNHMHKISRQIVSRELVEGIYIVTARATTPDGRSEESIGAVPLMKEGGSWVRKNNGDGSVFQPDGTFSPLSPDQRANKMMHAETKAKRRAVLSLVGLSILDESELDTIREMRPSVTMREVAPHAIGSGEPAPKARSRADEAKLLLTRVRKAFDIADIDQVRSYADDLVCIRFGLGESKEATADQIAATAEAALHWTTPAVASGVWHAMKLIQSAENESQLTDIKTTLDENGGDDPFVLATVEGAFDALAYGRGIDAPEGDPWPPIDGAVVVDSVP